MLLTLLVIASVSPAPAQDILGVWRPERYVLKDGAELAVDGRIFFAEEEWTVLFFVTDEGGEPRRGSAEGGTYRLEGDRLEFTHLFHLSAGEAFASLADAPLRMSVAGLGEAAREPCRVELEEDEMTIYFPSGNRMQFRRR